MPFASLGSCVLQGHDAYRHEQKNRKPCPHKRRNILELGQEHGYHLADVKENRRADAGCKADQEYVFACLTAESDGKEDDDKEYKGKGELFVVARCTALPPGH